MEPDNLTYPKLELITNENSEGKPSEKIRAYGKLIELSIAVRSYMINPTLLIEINKVKTAYRNYVPFKKQIKIPTDWENFEKELIKETGGLLQNA